MSAYMVDADTIDLLVAAADAWRLTFAERDGDDAAPVHVCSHRDAAGQLLWDENARSVNARYRTCDAPPAYSWTPICLDRAAVGMPIAVLVLGSVRCLRYQSCETEDYAQTRAARLLDAIEAAACRRLIDAYDAPWGFTRAWMDEALNAAREKAATR